MKENVLQIFANFPQIIADFKNMRIFYQRKSALNLRKSARNKHIVINQQMKEFIGKITRSVLIAAFLILTLSAFYPLYADPPDPPGLPDGHGYEGNVPAGAPVDSGVIILLGLGLVFGVSRILKMKGKVD